MSLATEARTPLPPTTTSSDQANTRRHGIGFWLIALAFSTAMAFSTVPSPLYALYQRRDGFSTFMLTIVFAVYAVGVITSLLLAGHVSDWVGRKKILIPALALELLAATIFLTDPSLLGLLLARFVTGLGVGMITATATAYLLELHSQHDPTASAQRFEIVSTAANIGGLGVGSLIAGFLAQWVDAPLRTPYVVFAALLALSILGVALTPETIVELPVRRAYHPQGISADHGDHAGYIVAAAAGFAAFTVFGLFTSVASGFVAGTLHHSSHALSGAVVFAVFAGAALSQPLTSPMSASAKMNFGVAAEAVGTIALVAGMHTLNFAAFLVGGIVAGVGAGVLFKAATGAVAAFAIPTKRSETLASLFFISYLGLVMPVIGIGITTRDISATTAMTWLAAILLLLLVSISVLARRHEITRRPARRRSRRGATT